MSEQRVVGPAAASASRQSRKRDQIPRGRGTGLGTALSPMMVAAAITIGAASIVVLGFIVVQLIEVRNGSLRRRIPAPAARVTGALAVALIVAIGIGQVFLVATGGSSFATAGQQRYVSAPLVYGAFALIALATTRYFAPRWPAWVLGLIAITVLSTLWSPLAGPRFTTGTLLQGIVLFGGSALFAICGLLNADWSTHERTRLLQLLLGVGGLAGLLGLATGIFSALVLPTAVIFVYLGVRRARMWPVLLAAGIFIIVRTLMANADAIDPSAASNGQLVVGGAVLALAILPRRFRLPLVLGGLLVGLLLLSRSDVPGLFFGVGADLEDVTLAQRAYETNQVVAQAAGNPAALLFGAGPGATVDLTYSPDSTTLAGSGRELAAVPSVHLLTSYILLKTGLIGLLWLGGFLAAAVAAAVRTLAHPRPDLFDLVLVVLVLCSIIQAVPAGSFLFSNPLAPLLLAILHVRHLHTQERGPLYGSHFLDQPMSHRAASGTATRRAGRSK